MNKTGYAFRFIAFIILLFILVAVGIYLGGVFFTKQYPRLSTNDSLRDTVSEVFSEDGRSARITSTSNRKFTLPWAKRLENGEEVSLTRVVKEGDVLIKKESSDTIILIQDKKKYTFVAYKTIK
jgi:hypothetical protein